MSFTTLGRWTRIAFFGPTEFDVVLRLICKEIDNWTEITQERIDSLQVPSQLTLVEEYDGLSFYRKTEQIAKISF